MDKFLKIVGLIVVAWIALSLIGWIFGFLIKAVFIVAIVVGVVLLVSAVVNRSRNRGRVGSGRW
jgi:hypothetical protein